MKRIFAMILAVLMIAALAACGDESAPASSQTPGNGGIINLPTDGAGSRIDNGSGSGSVDNSGSGSGSVSTVTSTPDVNTGDFDAAQVASKIDVKAETYKRYSSSYLVLVLTNNAGVNCDLTVDVDFYDADGKIVGTKTDNINAFAAGTSVASPLSCDEEFTKYDYTITAEETDDFYQCVDQDLTTEITTTSKKAIVSVTNNSTLEAKSTDAYVLFYKGDTLVDCGWGYLSNINAGATSKDEVSCWADDGFDTAKVYVHAYSYK